MNTTTIILIMNIILVCMTIISFVGLMDLIVFIWKNITYMDVKLYCIGLILCAIGGTLVVVCDLIVKYC